MVVSLLSVTRNVALFTAVKSALVAVHPNMLFEIMPNCKILRITQRFLLRAEASAPQKMGSSVQDVSHDKSVTGRTKVTYTCGGHRTTFIAGLDRPLPLRVASEGNLVVDNYAT